MRSKALLIPLFILLLVLPAAANVGVADSDDDSAYIALRLRIRTMYIENESIMIKIKPTLFRVQGGNDIPTDETLQIHCKIEGESNNIEYETEFSAQSQTVTTQNLRSLPIGRYSITIHAEKGNIESRKEQQEFGVFKPPIPYHIHFRSRGSAIDFYSKKLNETGHLDPKYNFTLKIFRYRHGSGETLIKTVKNVVDITIEVKEEWRDGVIIVDVFGPNGWVNSANMVGDSLVMRSPPIRYNYDWDEQEPVKSKRWFKFPVVSGIGVGLIIALMKADDKYGR